MTYEKSFKSLQARFIQKNKDKEESRLRDLSSVSSAEWSVIVPSWTPAGGGWNCLLIHFISLISSGSKYLESTSLKCRLSRRIFGCFMTIDWLAIVASLVFRVWNLRLIGTHFIPYRLNLDPWGSHWWLQRMTIVEFLIKIIDEYKTWITWFFQCYQGFRLLFHAPKMGCFL